MLLAILAPHFTAGLEMEEGVAKRCAPIIKYMLGWDYKKIESYCSRKGWQLHDCCLD